MQDSALKTSFNIYFSAGLLETNYFQLFNFLTSFFVSYSFWKIFFSEYKILAKQIYFKILTHLVYHSLSLACIASNEKSVILIFVLFYVIFFPSAWKTFFSFHLVFSIFIMVSFLCFIIFLFFFRMCGLILFINWKFRAFISIFFCLPPPRPLLYIYIYIIHLLSDFSFFNFFSFHASLHIVSISTASHLWIVLLLKF